MPSQQPTVKELRALLSQAESRAQTASTQARTLKTRLETLEHNLHVAEFQLEQLSELAENIILGRKRYDEAIARHRRKNQSLLNEIHALEEELQAVEFRAMRAKNEVMALRSRLAAQGQETGEQKKKKSSSSWSWWWQTPKVPASSTSKPQPATVIPQTTDLIANWRKEAATAFADYSKIQVFPSPPQLVTCASPARCAAIKSTLKVCKCSVQRAFRDVENLKKERLAWHPDRFSVCLEEHREEFQLMAEEMFKVVDEMYQRELEGK